MLSVASLLNPAPSGPSRHRLPPSPVASSPTNSFADETAFFDRPIMPKQKVAKDAAVFTKGKPKGTVNFQPYERLDEPSLREARKFQVFPLGKIQDYCRHIPYNSGKKDFFEKTGRESFEVFQYVFKLPGDDTEYVVMWDYNVGLVRMTPFFKCCKYSKTTPAKMLNMNPGLKEITHSITGGSIMAQGYWMPFSCAKAVCATFCYRIAGALIPIFGTDFPSVCIPPDAPEHGRMIIDPTIIIHSTREADRFRRLYSNMVTSGDCGGISPSRDHRRPISLGGYNNARPQYPRLRVRSRPFISSENPYGIDTDGEVSPATDRGLHGRFLYSPIQTLTPLRPPTSSWTPANNPHPHPHHHHHYDTAPPPPPPPPSLPHSHWLSAVPRLASPQPYHHTTSPMHASRPAIYHHHHHHSHVPHMTPFAAPSIKRQHPPQRESPRKRSAEHLEHGHSEAVRVGSSGRRDETSLHSPAAFVSPTKEQKKYSTVEGVNLGPEKKAALLLMNLSVRDAITKSQGRPGGIASASTSPTDPEFPRKRQRASSM
ncbi:APSES transcription factor Xbp1 [Apiospora saccharicola]|uniref:APSES transcription factor Xbp1 n=1 Tax=Apiospora saccharicola TaxID=335842 RepID=A0ABR1UL74_9PEZI